MIPIAIKQIHQKDGSKLKQCSYHHHHHHHHHVVMAAAAAVAMEMAISVEWMMNKWEGHRSGLACASNDRGETTTHLRIMFPIQNLNQDTIRTQIALFMVWHVLECMSMH